MKNKKTPRPKKGEIKFKTTKDIKPLLKVIVNEVYARFNRDQNITTLSLLLVGLLNRTYELTESAIWGIDHDRPQTSAHMLRALMETLGFIYYLERQLEKAQDQEDGYEKIAQALFGSRKDDGKYKQVNILTTIDKAVSRYSQLRKNYDDISEIVHPNAASHFYTAKPIDESKRTVQIILPFYQFKNMDKLATINQVGECTYHITEIGKRLLTLS